MTTYLAGSESRKRNYPNAASVEVQMGPIGLWAYVALGRRGQMETRSARIVGGHRNWGWRMALNASSRAASGSWLGCLEKWFYADETCRRLEEEVS